MGFNRRKMEDQRRQAAEKEAAAPSGDGSPARTLALSTFFNSETVNRVRHHLILKLYRELP
jgi:hypothetical protein